MFPKYFDTLRNGNDEVRDDELTDKKEERRLTLMSGHLSVPSANSKHTKKVLLFSTLFFSLG